MNFDDMIIEYDSYTAELKNFKSYLLADNPVINNKILGGIRTEHIIESIEYNIEHNAYNSKSIASKYAIGIAQFFRFATSNGWFTNDNLIQEINIFLCLIYLWHQIRSTVHKSLKTCRYVASCHL